MIGTLDRGSVCGVWRVACGVRCVVSGGSAPLSDIARPD